MYVRQPPAHFLQVHHCSFISFSMASFPMITRIILFYKCLPCQRHYAVVLNMISTQWVQSPPRRRKNDVTVWWWYWLLYPSLKWMESDGITIITMSTMIYLYSSNKMNEVCPAKLWTILLINTSWSILQLVS